MGSTTGEMRGEQDEKPELHKTHPKLIGKLETDVICRKYEIMDVANLWRTGAIGGWIPDRNN